MIRDPASLTGAANRSEAALSAQADAADDEEGEYEDGPDEADWGLQKPKSRMPAQTVLGLSVIVVLLGMFSVLIFKKVQQRKAEAALQSADAVTVAKVDPENPKSEEQGGDKPTRKGRGVEVTRASHSKAKSDVDANGEDPFGTLPALASAELPAGKSSGTRRAATPTTTPPAAESNELFDTGLPGESAPQRTPLRTENRGELARTPELGDSLPDQSAGSRSRTASGRATLGSRAPKSTTSASDLIEVKDLPGLDEIPPQKSTKVGGHSHQNEKAIPKAPSKSDEFPISSADESDPFNNNTEPRVPVKREVKVPQSTPSRIENKSDESEAFDPAPTPVAKSVPKGTNVRRLPAEERPPANLNPSPEELGGFEVAKDPPLRKIPVESSETNPSLAAELPGNASDPRLGGFQPVENAKTRAVSRTMVKRSAHPIGNSPESRTDLAGNRSAALAGATELEETLDPVTVPVTPVTPQPAVLPHPVATPQLGVNPRRQPTPVAARSGATDIGHNPAAETYVIAPNDNFWLISRKQYGSGRYFQALLQHNKSQIADPTKMRPGTVISTPPREVLEKQFPQLIDRAPAAATTVNPKTSSLSGTRTPALAFSPGPTPNFAESAPPAAGSGVTPAGFFVGQDGQPMYRVGQGDTLSDIAQKHLGRASRWDEIYNRNSDVLQHRDALKIGTVIRLPTDASRLSFVPEGGDRR